MSKDDKVVDVALRKLGETDRALKVTEGEAADAVWLPKSQVEENDDGTFTMPAWLASEKGFAGY